MMRRATFVLDSHRNRELEPFILLQHLTLFLPSTHLHLVFRLQGPAHIYPKTKSAMARLLWSHASVEPIVTTTVSEAVDDTVCNPLRDDLQSQDGKARSDELPLLGKGDSTDPGVDNGEASVVRASGWKSWNAARAKGLGFIVFSSLNYSIASACIKYESGFFGSQEAVFWRSSIGLLLNYVSGHSIRVVLG
jgi:hypothetical protein